MPSWGRVPPVNASIARPPTTYSRVSGEKRGRVRLVTWHPHPIHGLEVRFVERHGPLPWIHPAQHLIPRPCRDFKTISPRYVSIGVYGPAAPRVEEPEWYDGPKNTSSSNCRSTC